MVEARHAPRIDLDAFTSYVWEHPNWCPATRLAFEVQHAFERDTQTRVTGSDMIDLVRIKTIPYVEVFTCDNSKRVYLQQLMTGRRSRLAGCAYWGRCRITRDVRDVIEALQSPATP